MNSAANPWFSRRATYQFPLEVKYFFALCEGYPSRQIGKRFDETQLDSTWSVSKEYWIVVDDPEMVLLTPITQLIISWFKFKLLIFVSSFFSINPTVCVCIYGADVFYGDH